MRQAEWSSLTTWDEVCRRAAGRRHYNSYRQFLRDYRRLQILERCGGSFWGLLHRTGLQGRLAKELGVSKSTICRDVKALLDRYTYCPCCGQPVPPNGA